MLGAIYARYSPGPNQTDQSIEGQVADCRAYAEENGIQIVEIYADRHISGKSVVGRNEFLRMLHDAEQRRFECVIVWKIDRFGRDRQDIALSKMKLKRAGVHLMYARESVPDGPEGIILESVLEGLAEYYSAELAQKLQVDADGAVTDAPPAQVGDDGPPQAMQERTAEEDRDARRTRERVDIRARGNLDVRGVHAQRAAILIEVNLDAVQAQQVRDDVGVADERHVVKLGGGVGEQRRNHRLGDKVFRAAHRDLTAQRMAALNLKDR